MQVDILSTHSLEEFLTRLGAKDATPGGGGAAALAGACAAALLTMVARLTAGRPAFARLEERVQAIIQEGDRLRSELTAAIDADAVAFEAVMAAYGLPRSTATEKEVRRATLQPALRGATETPLAIARACLALLPMATEMAESGNPQTITDAGTSVLLAQAGLQSAILQARVNLKAIEDEVYVAQMRQDIADLLLAAKALREQAMAAVEQKLG